MKPGDFLELQAELKAGNNQKLKEIFESNAAYCIGKLRRKHQCALEDAQDIYADAILNLRDKIVMDKIEPLLDLRSYLFGTCRNMLLLRIKKNQRISHVVQTWYDPLEPMEGTAEEIAWREGMIRLTEKALATIGEKCQQILKAFYFDQLSMETIAQQMAMANANVAKVSKARCFQKLVEYVKNFEQGKSSEHVVD